MNLKIFILKIVVCLFLQAIFSLMKDFESAVTFGITLIILGQIDWETYRQ